ncbi:unnamed protein product [Urochloa decumbens]
MIPISDCIRRYCQWRRLSLFHLFHFGYFLVQVSLVSYIQFLFSILDVLLCKCHALAFSCVYHFFACLKVLHLLYWLNCFPWIAFDISELNLPKTTSISFPNGKDDLMNFEIIIRPDEGYYMGGTFVFTFQVSASYPHEPPKVKCKTKVYHPNIDLEGNVCLNILREDWKPVLNINTVIYGLNLLFTQPNDEDPLNHEAAVVLRDNPKMFEANVKRAMAGGYVGQHYFPRCA